MILQVQDLSYFYHSDKILFQNANFSLEEGSILSILGPNGAGKSTMLNCLVNLLSPKSGKILLDGKDISTMSAAEIARYIGYVPQINLPTYGFMVKDYIAMGRAPKIGLFSKPSKKDYELVQNAMERMEIAHLANKPYTEISGGERQKASIAKALVQEPKIIILDEPTAYLDFGNQHKTVKLVKSLAEEGYTVIMTTHQPDHVIELNEYVAVIDRGGKFSFGKTSEIVSEDTLSALYDICVKLPYIEKLDKTAVCAMG